MVRRPALSRRHAGRQRTAVAARTGWTLLDQAMSSVVNMALSVVVARALPSEQFGAFALSFAVYLVCLGLSRALATDPLAVRFSACASYLWRDGVRQATSVALTVGAAAGGVLASASLLVADKPLSSALLALAVALPGLLLQDAWRFAFFAQGQPRRALANDAAWGATLAFLLLAVQSMSAPSLWQYMAAWGAAAGIASLFGVYQFGGRPRFASPRRWLSTHGTMWPSFVGEFIVQQGVSHAILMGAAYLAGLEVAGALRGAQVIFGPVNVVLMAAVALSVPEAARLARSSRAALFNGMVVLSACVAVCALGWGAAAAGVPDRLGRELLGETWMASRPVIPWLAAAMTLTAASTGAVAGLRVLEHPRASLVVRVLVAPLLVVGGLLGSMVAGANGTVAGQLPAMLLGVALWWRSLHEVASERRDVREDPASR